MSHTPTFKNIFINICFVFHFILIEINVFLMHIYGACGQMFYTSQLQKQINTFQFFINFPWCKKILKFRLIKFLLSGSAATALVVNFVDGCCPPKLI